MKIVGSTVSPFTRIVRVMCEELDIRYDFEVTPSYKCLDDDAETYITSYNPLSKIPILIDEGNTIIESRIIANYLVENYASQVKKEQFKLNDDKNLLISVMLGVVDAGIMRFMLQATHPEINETTGHMARLTKAMESGLDWLDKKYTGIPDFGAPEIILICGLDWIKKRDIYPWESLDNLTDVYKKHLDRPSFENTKIPDSV